MYLVLFSDNSSALLFFWLHCKHFAFYGFLFILFIVFVALCLVSLFEYAFVVRWFLIYSSALAPLGTYGYLSAWGLELVEILRPSTCRCPWSFAF